MSDMTPLVLKEWESFYVIVGSSAGALTGLQFVVLTLIAEFVAVRGSADTLSAFGSPNVVHFCVALLVSAILSSPWHGLGPAGFSVTLCGVGGLLYCLAVLRRARNQSEYTPVLEDWVWHTILPILAYAILVGAGFELARAVTGMLFPIGAATLLLIFIGIHNAWDTVTYVTLERTRELRSTAARETTTREGSGSPPETGTGMEKA
jgi:hypothetical protein